jgi:hypothetical protein
MNTAPISAETKTRVLDILFADGCASFDQVNNRLSRAHRVISCLNDLAELRQDDTNEIGGELALAVAGLVDQDIQIARAVLNGWAKDVLDG